VAESEATFSFRESRVAQYFFHLCDGHEVVIDPEGKDIADPSLVGADALKEARAMIAQDALAGRINLNQYIEVRDDTGSWSTSCRFGMQ